jgi:DNA-binding CsgD family transcriptional regulator
MNSPYKEAQFKLTERQRQIVRELAQGITNKESVAGLGWRKVP